MLLLIENLHLHTHTNSSESDSGANFNFYMSKASPLQIIHTLSLLHLKIESSRVLYRTPEIAMRAFERDSDRKRHLVMFAVDLK